MSHDPVSDRFAEIADWVRAERAKYPGHLKDCRCERCVWCRGLMDHMKALRQQANEAEDRLLADAAASPPVPDVKSLRDIAAEMQRFHDDLLNLWGDAENCEDCGDKSQAGNDEPCALHASAKVARFLMGEDFGPQNEDKPFPRISVLARRIDYAADALLAAPAARTARERPAAQWPPCHYLSNTGVLHPAAKAPCNGNRCELCAPTPAEKAT